jgi:type II secretory pathway component PulF
LEDAQVSLLAVIRGAIDQKLPLAPLVRSLSNEYSGGYRKTLKRLANLLEKGVPLIEALEQVPDALSEHAVLSFRLGVQSGAVFPALQMLKDEVVERTMDPPVRSWKSFWLYWIVLFGILLVLLTVFQLRIAPSLRHVVEELGLQAPRFGLILQYLGYAWAAFLILVLWLITTSWSFRLRRLIRTIFRMPTGRLDESKESVLRLLGMTTNQGRPVIGALSTMAKYQANSVMRSKLLVARNEIEHGVDAWDALKSVGLLNSDQADALKGESSISQSWILSAYARCVVVKREARERLATALIHPIMVLAVGWVVLVVCLYVFGLLYGLVYRLS